MTVEYSASFYYTITYLLKDFNAQKIEQLSCIHSRVSFNLVTLSEMHRLL